MLRIHYITSCYTSSRFFENQPDEICGDLSEKGSKDRFCGRDKLQNHANEVKGKEKNKERGRRKEGKRKTAMVALLVFIMATLEIWPKKKTVGRKGPFAVNVFKNPARNVIVIAKRIFFCEYQIVTPLLFRFKLKSFGADKLLPVCPQPEVT